MCEVDTALGCLLGFYMGNGIQANSGRVYKWCPFWGEMGTTTARVTSITRANDYYSKSRIPVTFGSQISGHKGWDITNPKEKMVSRMLQLLQQRAGSGPVLALLKMQAWEPQPRMFKQGQTSAQGKSAQEAQVTSMDKQGGAAREKRRCAMPIWWSKSGSVESRKNRNNKIGRLLRWTMAARSTLGESTQKYLLTRKKEYLILEGDRAGANAVMADQYDTEWELKEKRYWGVCSLRSTQRGDAPLPIPAITVDSDHAAMSLDSSTLKFVGCSKKTHDQSAYLRGEGGASVGTGNEGAGGAARGRGGCSKEVLSPFSPLSIEIRSDPPGCIGGACEISVTPSAYSCRDSPSTLASSSSSPSPKSSSSSGP